MPDSTARKRLKKKMLDRWENEGGRIAADSTIADESNPASKPESADNRLPASRHDSTASKPTVRGRKRQVTQK
ncbi:MAG: hypothetical protein ABR568_16140 [Pyrinomonadaceae bacterium]